MQTKIGYPAKDHHGFMMSALEEGIFEMLSVRKGHMRTFEEILIDYLGDKNAVEGRWRQK